ncbi:MAG: glycosyltransferase [Thiobacillaceae bacterium]|nr:glycosyltransferase [Thiobacillaceae bacterium]MCX7693173.1 glycosyltransferase [Tepidimonas taiwanensis]MDW8322673.1 glycosyltransferase [Burkholderiales bacterium]
MRILLLSDVYFPRINGVSTSIQTLRRELLAAGHAVTLVAPAYGGEPAEAGVIRVPGWQPPFDPEDRLMHWPALTGALAALPDRPDVVHVHTPFCAHYAGLRLARRLEVPVVESYHTLFAEYFHHYLPILPRPWLKALARTISRRQCAAVDAVVAPSVPMRDALREYGVRTRIEVIPTGLLPEAFVPGNGAGFRAAHGLPAHAPVLLYVGRVAFEKNIGFLLDMMAVLRRSQPQAILVIAGEGPAGHALRQQVRRLGLEGQVRFVGYLDRQRELPDCYRAADLFVFASKTETQGLVLLEAMAQGTPVVALAEMGTREVLVEGEGCRIAPDEPAAFAAIVGELLADAEQRRRLAQAALTYAQAWRAERMVARVAQLYAELAASSRLATGRG